MPYDLLETKFSIGDTAYRVVRDSTKKVVCPVCHGTGAIKLREENGGEEIRCIECYGNKEVNQPCAYDWQIKTVRVLESKAHKQKRSTNNFVTEVEYEISPGMKSFGDPEWVKEFELSATEEAAQERIKVLVNRAVEHEEIRRKHNKPD